LFSCRSTDGVEPQSSIGTVKFQMLRVVYVCYRVSKKAVVPPWEEVDPEKPQKVGCYIF